MSEEQLDFTVVATGKKIIPATVELWAIEVLETHENWVTLDVGHKNERHQQFQLLKGDTLRLSISTD